jgi:WhiB family redox-sensing transcriptional regulator
VGDFAIYEPTTGDTDSAIIRRRKRRSVLAVPVASSRGQQPLAVDVRHLYWQLDAACYGMDSELFFGQDQPVQMLRRICADCPVITQCRDYADEHELAGFWGGATENERRLDRRRARRAARRAINAQDPPSGP